MGDSTSAGIFGDFFCRAAQLKLTKDDKLVKFMWDAAPQYDFSPHDMECDAALIKLGLARRGIDPDYSEDEETTIYDE